MADHKARESGDDRLSVYGLTDFVLEVCVELVGDWLKICEQESYEFVV